MKEEDYTDRSLEAIEARIHQLEMAVSTSKDSEVVPILPRLAAMSKETGQALSGRDRIAPLVRRLKELQGYLDPTFGESKGLSADVKADIVLSRRDQLIESQLALSQVASKSKLLDTNIASLPEKRLIELSKVHIDQEEKANGLGQSTIELIGQYNEIMATITETFVRYDEVIRAAENLKRAKQDQPDL